MFLLGHHQASEHRLLDRQRSLANQVPTCRTSSASAAPPSVLDSWGLRSEPFVVQNSQKPPENTAALGLGADRFRRRIGLLDRLESAAFPKATAAATALKDHKALYHQTARMILSPQMACLQPR